MSLTSSLDLKGKRSGRLVVVEEAGRTPAGARLLRCVCDCGNECIVRADGIRIGRRKSCGCINRRHGHAWAGGRKNAVSPTYRSWTAMLTRCTNPNSTHFARYGGRGITVCERWRSFENFLADMGERPEGKTLDRIDNDGNYEFENCRWATRSEQQHNKPRRIGTVQRLILNLLADGPRSAERLAYDWPTLSRKQASDALYLMYTGRNSLVDLAGVETGRSGRLLRVYCLTPHGHEVVAKLNKEEPWQDAA